MKTCPVCNDSFADELNFCDVDGVRLTREGTQADRNKWWSLLGAGLLVGAVVITAASIIFLPKARVASPVVSSEPAAVQPAPKPPVIESTPTVASAATASPDDAASTDEPAPEPKKKEKAVSNDNASTPNPKSAALASEDSNNGKSADESSKSASDSSKPVASPATPRTADTHNSDSANKPTRPAPDVKKDSRPQPAVAKTSNKESGDKKKTDDKDKDKKKGGFLRVFKKIFGKD